MDNKARVSIVKSDNNRSRLAELKRRKRARRPQRKVLPRRRRDPTEARRELLDAAERVLAIHGPDAVGLRDVAREAGVSHGLVTHYFGTYDALVEAVFARRTERLAAEIAERLAHTCGSPSGRSCRVETSKATSSPPSSAASAASPTPSERRREGKRRSAAPRRRPSSTSTTHSSWPSLPLTATGSAKCRSWRRLAGRGRIGRTTTWPSSWRRWCARIWSGSGEKGAVEAERCWPTGICPPHPARLPRRLVHSCRNRV